MSKDYKVRFISEAQLARFADWLRKQARFTTAHVVDIVDLIERVLTAHFADKGGLKVEFFKGDRFDEPAYVTFRPLTLHVDRTIWADAKKGCGRAYFILAHEIAHLLFHDYKAVAFSTSSDPRLKAFQKELSAEWQADTFAKHLTVPDSALLRTSDATVLAIVYNVEAIVAIERLSSYLRTGPMLKIEYEGEACGECGNFTLVRNGTCMKCNTCGSTTGCS